MGIARVYRNFYGLRRTFRTIADETNDQPAIHLIMGHEPKSNDMAAVYRQRIGEDRLRKVVVKVREWLFPGDPLDWEDPNHRKAAQRLCTEWDGVAKLSGGMVASACKLLGITEHELGRGTGLNSQWLSVVILGKRPMSSDTELKIRLYVQQIAEGKTPKPLAAEQLQPGYASPADVPLTDAAIAALLAKPLSGESLAVLADCLAGLGIPQTTLAQWWHLKYKFYQDLRYGRKPVPPKAADRLRVLFGFPPAYSEVTARPREFGKIPATPQIVALFEIEDFGREQVRECLRILRFEFGIYRAMIASWIGISIGSLNGMVHNSGKPKAGIRSALRSLFTFEDIEAGNGGAR